MLRTGIRRSIKDYGRVSEREQLMQDNQIINLYFERKEEAITQTDIKYGKYCHVIAWNILYNEEDSEECVNDAYLQTWNAIPPVRPVSLKAFIGKITRNTAINLLEKNTAGKRGGTETVLCLDELAECVSGRDEIGSLDDYRHLVRCLNRFLEDLPKEQRMIFVRRYWYGSSVREIAQAYAIGESKVKVTLSRLRGRLKDYLEKEGVHV